MAGNQNKPGVCCGYFFNPLDQGVLVKGHSFSALVEVVLVPDAELQDLSGVQPLQVHAAGGRLATQHSCGGGAPSSLGLMKSSLMF